MPACRVRWEKQDAFQSSGNCIDTLFERIMNSLVGYGGSFLCLCKDLFHLSKDQIWNKQYYAGKKYQDADHQHQS